MEKREASHTQEEEEDNGESSLHALKGLTNSKIIKVEGQVEESKLMILIDNGSTHSFLDEGTARFEMPLNSHSAIDSDGGQWE